MARLTDDNVGEVVALISHQATDDDEVGQDPREEAEDD
jgi:hypothetical protein